ncbi:hypothetical protein Cgig2_003467 [Carnegiea gigantea]|uniref:Sugar phosphate transporter domain-containing protein n=1 Tax=Carnegiea gigantea TaxID=171969 RepID=A0A9Q1QFE3_9CARY|nr:hypothetical protein Cgig2_003467 [Carnegiea gigantea]
MVRNPVEDSHNRQVTGRGNSSPCPYNTRLATVDPIASECGLGFRGRVSLKGLKQGSRGLWVVRATSVPETADGGAEAEATQDRGSLVRGLQLTGMFGLWYLLNIYFNIFNKQVSTVSFNGFNLVLPSFFCCWVLRVYPFPSTLTAFQFGCGSLLVLLMWGFNLHPRPKITRSQFAAILPLAVAHAMGNLLTNVSLGKVAVSFTHTIKAMEPFFTVILSALFLPERPSIWVVASLVPIVAGVALEAIDNINLFSVITLICFVLLVPAAFLIDGVKFTPPYLQSIANQGVNVRELCVKALLSGLCFHTYQQVSYMILGMVSAVTHSVGNCLKRVVVIVSSVIFFQTAISPLNSFGTALALAGVFLYSRAKQLKENVKAA